MCHAYLKHVPTDEQTLLLGDGGGEVQQVGSVPGVAGHYKDLRPEVLHVLVHTHQLEGGFQRVLVRVSLGG